MVHSFSRPDACSGHIGRGLQGLTLTALLILGGCASAPPPDGAMNIAQAQLQAARDADAADYAPVDLGFAQNKFQQAQAAMASRDYEEAANLADEARADAELALAKARLGEARAKIQSKMNANARLRERMEQAHPELTAPPAQRAVALPPLPGAPSQPGAADMPAPASSVLSAPLPQEGGFQTVPQQAPPSAADQGEQP
ncbi:DUF4398 domain-containing protein [Dyella sp.]|jgi:hypothetical protein|uniref:DUF4398 domain-containing protein n=1 Tax=Dyella sp. TaxID=1869338 RepID=UPI002D79D232|nr:DUF4398 domain-containing protein [Dyella sp.]HET6430835.1 DUF4398 domain-containing protein [Dyella sp.]